MEAFELREPSKGLRLLDDMVAASPIDGGIRTLRATYLLEAGELDAGLTDCLEAVRLAPDLEDARVELAHAYRARSQLETAIAILTHYLEEVPTSVNALLVLANTLVDLGRLPEALASYDRIIALQPESADVLGCAAVICARQGWRTSAEDYAFRAHRLGNSRAWFALKPT